LEVCRWIKNSSVLVAMRSSPWLFPIVATIHLFGLAIIGGSVLVVDLRLLGLGLRRGGRLGRDRRGESLRWNPTRLINNFSN